MSHIRQALAYGKKEMSEWGQSLSQSLSLLPHFVAGHCLVLGLLTERCLTGSLAMAAGKKAARKEQVTM